MGFSVPTTAPRPAAAYRIRRNRSIPSTSLEVFGDPGAVATINYVDINVQPQQVVNASLPWSLTMVTTQPGAFSNLVAQGNSDSLGCRILVDGVVKDERIVNEVNAYTFCLVKSG